MADLRGQRHLNPLPALAAHHQMSAFPIDVIERHSDYFARPQTEPRQQHQNRIVAQAHGTVPIAVIKHLLYLSRLKELR